MKKNRIMTLWILFICVILNLCMTGCNADSKKAKTEVKTIGITMNQTEQWEKDGKEIKSKLETLGYQVTLSFSEGDVTAQNQSIKAFVDDKVSCIVVAAVDGSSLVDTLEEAKSQGIPVIAYEELVKDTKAVNYYITFDDKGAGIAMGQKVEQQFQLATASTEGRSYTAEFILGNPNSKNDEVFYDGVMQVLDPYLDNKVIRCLSEKTEYQDCATANLDVEAAKSRLSGIISSKYNGTKPDMIVAEGELLGTVAQEISPDSYIACKLSKDHSILVNRSVKMIQNVADGYEPEINDIENYYNGKYIVPTYACLEEVQ